MEEEEDVDGVREETSASLEVVPRVVALKVARLVSGEYLGEGGHK